MQQGPALGHLVYDNYLPSGVVSSSKLNKESSNSVPLHRLCRVANNSTGKRRCAQPSRDVSTSLGATPAAVVAPATSARVRGT